MIKYNSDFHAYTDSTLLPNNQFAFILFLKDEDFGKKYYNYYVCFCIANKRKHAYAWAKGEKSPISGMSTGKTLHGLAWAKDKIEEFEEYISDSLIRKPKRIIVQGEDSRRFRIYRHFLERKGYKLALHPLYGWYMYKIIGWNSK